MTGENKGTGGRLLSLDVLRGFDMFFIMGGASLVTALCAACGCGGGWLSFQMQHEVWDGLTHHDTIFPLFLFIAGMSWPFSLAKRRAGGQSDRTIALGCLRRAAILFLLGLVYGGLLDGTVRLGSVLGRIGVAWMIAAWLSLRLGFRGRLVTAFGLLVGYWALLALVPSPEAATRTIPSGFEAFGRGPFSPVGNLSGWLDRHLPGVIIGVPGVMDNQSVLGYIPAAATAIFGTLTGEYVRTSSDSGDRKTVKMLVVAAALVGLGLLVAHGFGAWSMPINKKLWSSSFTLVVGGYSVGLFAVFYWLVDVRRWWTRTLFFRVIGLNAITIYLFQRFVSVDLVSKQLFGGLASLVPDGWAPVVLKTGYVALCWLLLLALHRKNVYLKV